jgi:hypothetical protein
MKKWDLFEKGQVIDTIEAESISLGEGFVTFYSGNDRIAITALGGGTVLRLATGQEPTYTDPKVELMEPPSRFDSDD